MSVEETDKIDFAIRRNDGALVLVIADHLPWGDSEHLLLLQEKLNSYLAFVETGQYLELEEAERGMPVTIQIAAKYPPDVEAKAFVMTAGEILGRAGIALTFRARPEQGERG